MRAKRASSRREQKNRLYPVLLSVFSLVADLLFDCSRVLEYAKIATVLQSITMLSLRIVNRFRFFIPNTGMKIALAKSGNKKATLLPLA